MPKANVFKQRRNDRKKVKRDPRRVEKRKDKNVLKSSHGKFKTVAALVKQQAQSEGTL